MPIDPTMMDDDYDPLDDYSLYKADDVFASWSDEVALRLKETMLKLKAYHTRRTATDHHAEQTVEYVGTIDDIFRHIASWVEEMPEHLALMLANPVLQPLFPDPDLTFLVRKTTSSCAIRPHLLNYPHSHHEDDDRPFINFRDFHCTIGRFG